MRVAISGSPVSARRVGVQVADGVEHLALAVGGDALADWLRFRIGSPPLRNGTPW